jgi:acyl-CoA reductase-like NAD-dependent aldehyde dehydrogenase
VRFVGFTGSTEVGKILYQQAAVGVKKLGLELGGNAPFVVFDDADIDAAVEGKPDALVAHEETFGPLAPVFRFKDEADVIAMCNNSPFGLASYFYSCDLGRVWRVAEALESGMVGVNTGLITTEVAPFGGVKESGLGREGSHHGMEEYVEIKYVMMAGV